MIRIIASLLFVTISLAARGQQYDNAFHIGWNTLVPFSDKDFTGNTSSAGIRLGYSKFMSDRFGLGLEAGYSTLNDYVPVKTYISDKGAITTDRFNYLYYLTVMANGQYYFVQGKHFIPYTSLGMGVALSQYKIFYNVYQEDDNNTAFVVRPEVGMLYKIKEYSSFGLKAALGFDYANNRNDYFSTDNLAGLNFQVGVVFLNR